MSKGLESVLNNQITLHKALTDFTSLTAQWIEERRKEAEEKDRKFQLLLFYQSIVVGLFVGIAGNLFSSYLMEALKGFGLSPWNGGIVVFISVAVIFIFVYPLHRKVRAYARKT